MAAAELPLAPDTLTDGGGFPRFGTYRGGMQEVNLRQLKGPYEVPLPLRPLKHKKWQYAQVCTPEVIATFTIAHLGYTASAFATVVDLAERRAVYDAGWVGLPGLTSVGDRPGEGAAASFRLPGVSWSCGRAPGQERYHIALKTRGVPLMREAFEWRGEVLAEGGPPPLTVVSPVPGGVVNVTQKSCGWLASGQLRVGKRRYELDGGVAGLDYTQGYLARKTSWRWAMANGRMPDGTAVGFNLVEGFNDNDPAANENALWLGARVFPLDRAKFAFNENDPLDEWRLSTADGAVALTFRAHGVHREQRDYRLVRSRFCQPIGLFQGTIRIPGQTLGVADLGGVTESQDVLW
jgi:hypothetical protein